MLLYALLIRASLPNYTLDELLDDVYDPELSFRAAQIALSKDKGSSSLRYMHTAINQGFKVGKTSQIQTDLGVWYSDDYSSMPIVKKQREALMENLEPYH